MKISGFLFFLILSSYLGTAQEIPAVARSSSEFIIKRLEITPSLTNLAPEIPNTGKFRIRTVNFDKEIERREVNIYEMMAMEERMRSRTVELAPPVYVPQESETFSLSRNDNFSASPRFYNQTFSPELPSKGTRNSVYKDASETTGSYYLRSYSPFYRQSNYYY
ncbi:MAG: hypothetical protein JJE07_12645 [Flavobacteriaceae bacterium]|nr:hypothetical protein [Flavobacteriaceae bacterium]